MGFTFDLEESDFKGFIPDGEILAARVIGVEVKKQPFQDKETGDDVFKVEFKFVVTDDDSPYDGVIIWGKTGTKFNNHPYCKLYTWSQAVLGMELPVDYRLDTDDLLDQDCRILVKLSEYTDKTGASKERNDVADVLPSRSNMGNFDLAAGDEEEPF